MTFNLRYFGQNLTDYVNNGTISELRVNVRGTLTPPLFNELVFHTDTDPTFGSRTWQLESSRRGTSLGKMTITQQLTLTPGILMGRLPSMSMLRQTIQTSCVQSILSSPLHKATIFTALQFHSPCRIAYKVAASSHILLKNTDGALPLNSPKKLAIIGSDAGPSPHGPNNGDVSGTLAMGWGSGYTRPFCGSGSGN